MTALPITARPAIARALMTAATAVPPVQVGVASGVFTTRRQTGGALAVAVFGGLLADPDSFVSGVRTSLLMAAAVLGLAAILGFGLPATDRQIQRD